MKTPDISPKYPVKNPMKTNFRIRLPHLLALAFLTGAQMASAQTTYLWNQSTVGVNDWNVNGNWNGANYPGFADTADTAVFGNVGFATSETVNNEVSVNTTVSALSYTNATSGNWFVTDIPADVTLTVTNLTVGGNSAGSGTLVTDAGLTDAGTLVVNGSLTIGNEQTASSGSGATLDLSGLNNFVYNNAAGTITLSTGNRSTGTLKLAAASNYIAAATFNDNIASTSSGGTGNITLGAGTNIIYANTFNVAAGRETSTISFPSGSSGGGLRIRGTGGTDTNLCNLTMGNHNQSGTSSDSVGTLSVDGYPVDIRLGTLTLGESSADPTVALYGNGVIDFDTGTIFANTIHMAITSVAVADAEAMGTINVGSGGSADATLYIGAGGLSMVNQFAGSGPATGTLTVTGGTVICSNSIIKTTAAGTATITFNSGTLTMVAGTVGVAGTNIDNLTFNSATLNLNADGNSATDDVYGNAVSASGSTINISSVANVTIPTTIHLISYNSNNGDPYSGFTLGSVPAGYTASLVDNQANGSIDLSIGEAGVVISSLRWVGAVGSTLNNNWDYTTRDWLNLANSVTATYTNLDFVYFDDAASNSEVTLLETNLSPGALVFSNSGAINGGLDYTLNGAGSLGGAVGLVKSANQNTGQAGTVTLAETGGDNFDGGITVNAGTLILDDAHSAISGSLVVASGATMQIGNNDANGNLPSGTVTLDGTLIFDQSISNTVATSISGGGALTQNGSGVLTLSASNSYTGNTTVNAGTLALTGAGTIADSAGVAVSGATLDLSGETGPTLNSLTIANGILNVFITNNLQPVNIVNGYLTMNGTTNKVNVAGLPDIAGYPTTITLVQSAYGLSGFNLGLGTLPAGYTGYVTNNSTAVLLTLTSGPVGVRPSVTWSGVDALDNLSTNWSDAQNWQLPGAPSAADNVIFNDTDAQNSSALSTPGGGGSALIPANVNNIVDANFTVSTLTYTNIGMYQNTLIENGRTLTITNSLAFGSSSVDFGDTALEIVTVSGTNGTLAVNNTNSPLVVLLESAGGIGSQATLDLSALGTFNAAVNTFQVGALATTAVIPSGVAYLAQTNNITAIGGSANETAQDETLSLMVGETGKNATTESYLYLGQENVINANTIGIGLAKQTAEMEFNSIWVNPTAVIRAADGISPVSVWSMGDGLAQTGSSTSPTGTADFTGGTVNALVTTMYLGATPNAAGPHPSTGTLTFGAGTINVATLFDGRQAYNTSDNGVGTVNVNGTGILQVGTLDLGFTTGTGESSPTTGTLNINGGTVEAGTIAGDTNNNTGQSTVTLNGGTLAITDVAGTPAAPLTTLGLNGGTLQLAVNGASGVTNVVATTVTTGGTTTLAIGSIINAVTGITYPLISYTGSDPYGSLSLGTLPTGYAGHLVDDNADGIIGLTLTSVSPPLSHLDISQFSLSGANVTINGTNQGTGTYYVLTSTNLTLPLSEWTPVATNVLSSSGSFTLTATNAVFPNVPQQFYLLSTTNK